MNTNTSASLKFETSPNKQVSGLFFQHAQFHSFLCWAWQHACPFNFGRVRKFACC